MIYHHSFKNAYLSINTQTSLHATVEMMIDVLEEDERKNLTKEYVNGVKITGEISFELPFYGKEPFIKGFISSLQILVEDSGTNFNLILLEKTGEVDVLPKKIKRHFWSFSPIGNPIYDRLDIFPVQYKNPSKINRVYWLQDFGKTIFVVASCKKEARELVAKRKTGVSPDFILHELDTNEPDVLLLENK